MERNGNMIPHTIWYDVTEDYFEHSNLMGGFTKIYFDAIDDIIIEHIPSDTLERLQNKVNVEIKRRNDVEKENSN